MKKVRFTAQEKAHMASSACVRLARLYKNGDGEITHETPGCRWAFILREELAEQVRQQIVFRMERDNLEEAQISQNLHPELLRLAKAEFNRLGWGIEITKALDSLGEKPTARG